MVKIAIGSDHAGYKVKEEAKKILAKMGYEVVDCGAENEESSDYPDYAKKVAKLVSNRKCDKGVLVCGSGQGMAMTANKLKNIRASLCWNKKSTLLSRLHNDANIFCSGTRLTPRKRILEYLKLWLKTKFEGGRHHRRTNKIG